MEPTETPEQTSASTKECYFIDCHAITAKGAIKTVTFGPFLKRKDECHLYELVQTLVRMDKKFRDTPFNPVQSDYEDVAGYLAWFDTGYPDAESFYDEYPDCPFEFSDYAAVAKTAQQFGGTSLGWPMEPATNYETPAKLESYEVFYIDANGVKSISEVEFDG